MKPQLVAFSSLKLSTTARIFNSLWVLMLLCLGLQTDQTNAFSQDSQLLPLSTQLRLGEAQIPRFENDPRLEDVGVVSEPAARRVSTPKATLTVTNLNDSGAGSLRQTVATAASGDTIVFQPGLTGTILLSTGRLIIQDKNLTILGPTTQPGIVIDGNNNDRIASFLAVSVPMTISISNLTFQNGRAGSPGAGDGGGCFFQRHQGLIAVTSTLTNCVIRQCSTPAVSTGVGGALLVSTNGAPLAGSITLNQCVVSENNAGSGGGGLANFGSTVTLNGCTVSNNRSANAGGGLLNVQGVMQVNQTTVNGNLAGSQGGAINNQESQLTLTNCTISGNTASNTGNAPGQGLGGGLCNISFSALPSPVSMQHCTVVNNLTTTGNGSNIANVNAPLPASTGAITVMFANCIVGNGIPSLAPSFGSVGPTASHTSLGYNIAGDVTAFQFGVNVGDQPNTNPQLLPLALNGGLTMTHVPALGSPAINTGNPNFVAPPATDQRGGPRVLNGRLDIGAVETDYLVRGPIISTVSPLAGQRGSSVTILGLNLNQATSIFFNGAPASFTVDSPTQITAVVPANATTGQLQAVSTAGTSLGPVFTVIRTK